MELRTTSCFDRDLDLVSTLFLVAINSVRYLIGLITSNLIYNHTVHTKVVSVETEADASQVINKTYTFDNYETGQRYFHFIHQPFEFERNISF